MSNTPDLVAEIEALGEKLAEAKTSITKRFIGQERVVDLVLAAILCGGHGLLVGLPGLGKTRLVDTLSTVLGLDGKRVQFTPDLMPADILGSEVLETGADGSRAFKFIPGPIFCQLLMADEVNRASPRTQSALLQAMQEKNVTVAGEPHDLPVPFHVLATQNPIEQEGTYPLPEAQRDRFLFNVIVNYPDREQEGEIIDRTTADFETTLEPVVTGPEIIECQRIVRRVPLPEHVREFVLDLVRSGRPRDESSAGWVKELIEWGPGPRACQQLVLAAKARAIMQGRHHVTRDDAEVLAYPVLRHRIVPTFNAEAEGVTVDDLISRLLSEVPQASSQLL